MFFSKEFSVVQNNIINLITVEDRPMTARELANASNVTYQTIKNHLMPLLAKGIIIEAGKGGANNNAMRYELGKSEDKLIQIVWKDETITVAQMMMDYASGKTPVAELPSTARGVVRMFAKLYKKCADTLDDPNQIITIGQMKTYQAEIAGLRNSFRSMIKTLDSMLEDSRIWDPRIIVSELMIKDESMSTEKARSIYNNIITVIGDGK